MLINSKKWQFVVGTTLVLTVLVLLFDLSPRYLALWDKVGAYYNSVNNMNSLPQLKANLKEIKFENSQLHNNINNLISDYKENKNLSSVLEYLDKNARRSKIKITEIIPGKLRERNNLWLLPIQVEMSTKYENIYNFVRLLENSNKVVLINQLILTPIKDNADSLLVKSKLNVFLNL